MSHAVHYSIYNRRPSYLVPAAMHTRTLNAVRRLAEEVGSWQLFALLSSAALIFIVSYARHKTHINAPTVGVPPGIFGPWKASFLWMSHSEAFLREGVQKYLQSGTTFKISTPSRWLVLVTSRALIQEIKNDTSELSFHAAHQERLSLRYTFSQELYDNKYHLDIISKKLTHKLTTVIPEVLEEIAMALEENMNVNSEWTLIDNYDIMLKTISRTANKIFIGLPLCRKQDYLDAVVEFATRAATSSQTIDTFPDLLKPAVAWLITDNGAAFRAIVTDVGPLFVERKRTMEELGDRWAETPNDAIQWILDLAPPDSSIESMCMRILFLNFAAIHTSSMSITHVLLDLGAHPEFQEPLRQEIESVLREFGGWSKQALTKMKKMDSCIRESQRLNAIEIAPMIRKATKSQTLSDGTFLPKGTWVAVPASALHHSEHLYENPFVFDPFRYSRMREHPGQEAKHQLVNVDENNLGFGFGNHACPGRFFAANALKILLASIICNYDFKTSTNGRPENTYSGQSCFPDISKSLLFRERPDRVQSSANVFM
ncbi:hypothetical protein PLICRDRAFT_179995 [Plicaturopsis crispa FD-325 SS-3]|uniref:Unplaced genomic scaffold PLICRscaffold_20, whole genome shotgun sequence n=1 Tax=Plicaturopsis crispa FD-325 SS-3 TaxID=944288 RepID=A0A0C9SQP6_PLICR|nr:hypothetical protein PLICRDRAFT_179995 [Plicaturopsis crispa FD-325 SS-3]